MNNLKLFSKRVKAAHLSHSIILNVKKTLATLSEELKRQNDMFNAEEKRQRDSVGRIEKIEVRYEGSPSNETLIMNKHLSTPYDCARHLGDKIKNRAVVALLNNDTLWHLHKPLPDSCKLELLHYYMPNPNAVNKTFWRSCSFLLGAVIADAFKDNIQPHLHSFPSPNVKSGSFVYDVQLPLEDWNPTDSELKVLSIEMIKYCQQDLHLDCLTVSKEIALSIFRNNVHKTQQIPDIVEHNKGKVTLYRVGNHIDISKGPMIPNTRHLGRITVTNVIKLDTDIIGGPIYRFQGVALPSAVTLNHFAYSLLENRAKNLNPARIPGSQPDIEDNTFVAQVAH